MSEMRYRMPGDVALMDMTIIEKLNLREGSVLILKTDNPQEILKQFEADLWPEYMKKIPVIILKPGEDLSQVSREKLVKALKCLKD